MGKLLRKLKALGIDDNTIVFFTSDNGPHREGGADPDFFDSNGPLRGIKRDLYEGGIRVPMIVRWPGRIEAGTTTNHVSAFWDILPTLATLAGAKAPKDTDGLCMVLSDLSRWTRRPRDARPAAARSYTLKSFGPTLSLRRWSRSTRHRL